MGSLFYGLNIAKNTLSAQTQVLNVTAHNVANANTPGYSRQTVNLTAISDGVMVGMQGPNVLTIGSGVEAKTVLRSRFALYDEMYRKENQDYNDFAKTEELYHQIELLFDEPSDRGFASIMDDFFNGWQDLANDPQNMAARQSLIGVGEELASRMQRLHNQLLIMRQNIDTEISTIPARINNIAAEIADLNASIRLSEIQGGSANDLRDKRDTLIDELSAFTDVRAVEQKDGTYTVIIGSKVIADHETYTELKAVTSVSGARSVRKTVIRSDDGLDYVPEKGTLGALIRFRDEAIEGVLEKLDNLAEAMVQTVNFEHRNGYGLDGLSGRNFFDPSHTKAYNISLSQDVSDPSKLAASGNGDKGDNTNALALNESRRQEMVDGQFTFAEYYNALIANIGVMAREAKSGRQNEEQLVAQINNAREGIKGVSIDEELIQMIQTQHIYQSASRVIVTLDSLLETLIGIK